MWGNFVRRQRVFCELTLAASRSTEVPITSKLNVTLIVFPTVDQLIELFISLRVASRHLPADDQQFVTRIVVS